MSATTDATTMEPRRRRWPKRLGLVALAVLALAATTYLRARLTLDSSTFSRALVWLDADVGDYRRFPSREIAGSKRPYTYGRARGYPSGLPDDVDIPGGYSDLEEFLSNNDTSAFIVIQDDRLLYERYFNGSDHDSIQTSFSVAKSFVSALVGIAVEDGHIALDDPVTEHIPELSERDPAFQEITIRHLITMSSGLRYEEQGTPWSDDTETYYAPDLRELALTDTEIIEPPGRRFHYNNYNPLLIGMILERTTGRHVADYMGDHLWEPLGGEAEASWSLDSEGSGFEKMESGINARAIDFAKLGSLYLHEGRWNGEQILPAEWVRESVAVDTTTDPSPDYQYWWWTYKDRELGNYFAAFGNKGQYVVVFPRRDLVVVRNGTDFGEVDDWPAVIADIARSL